MNAVIGLDYQNLYEFNNKINNEILILTIYYINSSERFEKLNFDQW